MISYIRGELCDIEEQKAIVDVNGVGYGIYMPQQALSLLPPMGQQVKIHTYLNIREDAMQLFGFLTKEDLNVFRLLIGVNGIGPKAGLNILSCLSPDELRFAVLSEDAKAISATPGIGKKTAEKLILELKDKLNIEDMLDHAAHGGDSEDLASGTDTASNTMQAEAVQALTALGYGSAESLRAVKKSSPECSSVEDILKEALKFLL
ncbi:Holliday junction branch migration protein RuvA [[Ruminococcus] lactaris]|uniref:Holliday junction branch migration complex subunit RuvA n=1 Tax=[Ruminococcus] lactaris TaxID=46228 RepID=A0A414PAQ0_9FIRM|nr:Holliday junction branch migration protein RuvA [[Ruminococcus] lactaris]RHF63409.1 Holliday junction branch migration protein RuvA [[Ruminococcus] lactaris]